MVGMESLLCDEVWPSSPAMIATDPLSDRNHFGWNSYCGLMYTTKEDYEQALKIFLEKEISYMPEPNYAQKLCSNNLVIARFKSIQWFIKSRSRLNLSLGTVFYAANYLDRFISMNHCNVGEYWMVELLSVACLSIASKFNDTCNPTLLEIQMEDLDHSFEPKTILRMEMMLLKALGWRLASTTAYSYLELLTWIMDSLKPQFHGEFIGRVNNLLLGAISDSKLLELRPSVVAISAIRSSLDQLKVSTAILDAYVSCLTSLLDSDQKVELGKFHKMMEAQSVDSFGELLNSSRAFPLLPFKSHNSVVEAGARVLTFMISMHVDFSLFKIRGQYLFNAESTRIKKRKREDEFRF